MIIPSEFNLFSHVIKVKYSRTLVKRKGALGLCDYNKSVIYLQQSTKSYPITKEQIEATVLHESLHMMLYKLGYNELAENETLVEGLSNILLQFFKQIEN